MIIKTTGAFVGRIVDVATHPRGQRIWLAFVDLGKGDPPVQIVFGGKRRVERGDLVPVAPPGARVTVLVDLLEKVTRTKKMRTRRYRGERSHGMLCSLDELGWFRGGPDEVPALCGLSVGESLDGPAELFRDHVVGWDRAIEFAIGSMVDDVLESCPQTEPATAGTAMGTGQDSFRLFINP